MEQHFKIFVWQKIDIYDTNHLSQWILVVSFQQNSTKQRQNRFTYSLRHFRIFTHSLRQNSLEHSSYLMTKGPPLVTRGCLAAKMLNPLLHLWPLFNSYLCLVHHKYTQKPVIKNCVLLKLNDEFISMNKFTSNLHPIYTMDK